MAPTNILITGAAGYIGGSVLAGFCSTTDSPIKETRIHASVRSEAQVAQVSRVGVHTFALELGDEKAITEAVLGNDVDIVVHTACGFAPDQARHLINALAAQKKRTGRQTVFVQSSVSTIYGEEAGWRFGQVKDTEPSIYENEKLLLQEEAHAVRETNTLLIDLAREKGVTATIIVVPQVYGRGTGEGRKLSVNIPAYVRTSIEEKIVYKFEEDGNPPAVHISDLVDLYVLVLEKILRGEQVPDGQTGYIIAMAHRIGWWEAMSGLAKSLYSRELVKEAEPRVWPSYEKAAEVLGFPKQHVRAMGTASGDILPLQAYNLGWKPRWTKEAFLANLDDEVQAVLDLDTIKPSIFNDLKKGD